jgi:hypothetical protein
MAGFLFGWMVMLMMCGCSQRESNRAFSGLMGEFKSAEPAMQAKVELAISALKTNNYVGTIVALQEVMSVPTLSRTQRKAIEDTLQVANSRLYEGVEKGDTNAIQAREVLQQLRRRAP